MKGTLEISLQFKKLTSNSTTSFLITFGLQCIIDEMIHVHNTHYTPPVHRLVSYRKIWTKHNRQDTGKTFLNVDIF